MRVKAETASSKHLADKKYTQTESCKLKIMYFLTVSVLEFCSFSAALFSCYYLDFKSAIYPSKQTV